MRQHLQNIGAVLYVSPIIEFADNPPVLVCTGDEDQSTQGRRRRALVQAFQAPDDVRVDLGGLGFADTSLMIDLALLSHRLRRRGRLLLLSDASEQTQRLIETVGLHRLPGVRMDQLRSDPDQPVVA